MKPELRRIGNSASPVVVVDEFSGTAEAAAKLADALAPFPPVTRNYYPGVRRAITPADKDANAYVIRTCQQAAQFIGGAFEIDAFDLTEASYSIVTVAPSDLQPNQRAPHVDAADPDLFAMIHYLRVPSRSGTAFYRQRSTGIERVTQDNYELYWNTATAEAAKLPADSGYIGETNAFYEKIGEVEAVPDRLVIYNSNLLHSGNIPRDMILSPDPREGRLTANFFFRTSRRA